MSEPCHGKTGPVSASGSVSGEGQGRNQRDVPRFVLGCEDDEQDMGQMETGMKNKMYREEDMKDDEDESVSDKC